MKRIKELISYLDLRKRTLIELMSEVETEEEKDILTARFLAYQDIETRMKELGLM